MKITYISCEAPKKGSATETHIFEIVRGLKDIGCDVDLFYPHYAHKKKAPALFIRLILCLFLQIKVFFKRQKGAIFYLRAHYLSFPTAVFAKIFGIPIFHEINGPYEDVFITYPQLSKYRRILTWMMRWQYRNATGLIAVTKQLQSWAEEQSRGRPVALIENGANTNIFKKFEPNKKPENAPERYVIFFGNFAHWHGIQVMMEAVKDPKWPENVKLVMIGGSEHYADIIEDIKLIDRIVYLGRQDQNTIARYAHFALAGLIPSTYAASETGILPLKLFEMMACGIPVIVSDLPGQGDLVKRHDCGVAIYPNDAFALARAVKSLSETPEKATKQGKNAFDLVQKCHSWSVKAKETHNFMKKLISPSPQ